MSEPFIYDQAAQFTRHHPLFVSRDAPSTRPPGAHVEVIADRGRQAANRYKLLRDHRPLSGLLREHGVDVVHAHFGVEGLFSLASARKLSIPHVTTLHGYDATMSRRALISSGQPSWVHYGLARGQLFSHGTAFICVSEQLADLAAGVGVPRNRIRVIPTGVDVDRIAFCAVPEHPTVVHVARLVDKKGTQYLIRALAAVRRRIPDVQLRIIGEGPLAPALRQLVADEDLAKSVTFEGARPRAEVLAAIGESRVLCLPSVTATSGDTEGLGQVLLEAGATGRPVVATRSGGIPQAVRDGVTGLLVTERSVPELAVALETLLLDSQLCERYGQAARVLVEDDFNLKLQSRKVEALYTELLNGASLDSR